MVPLDTEMVGNGATVTVDTIVFDAGHPLVPVPVTLKEVVVDGETVKLFPVTLYVPPPLGRITKD